MEIALEQELILFDVEAKDQFDALGKLADNLQQHGYVKDTYKEAVIAREKVFATGLPTLIGGVAIPHTDIQHVNAPAISVARLKKPVPFVIMGDDSSTVDVDLIFMLAMKEQHAQLELLQNLMGLLQDEEALRTVKTVATAAELQSFLRRKLQPEG